MYSTFNSQVQIIFFIRVQALINMPPSLWCDKVNLSSSSSLRKKLIPPKCGLLHIAIMCTLSVDTGSKLKHAVNWIPMKSFSFSLLIRLLPSSRVGQSISANYFLFGLSSVEYFLTIPKHLASINLASLVVRVDNLLHSTCYQVSYLRTAMIILFSTFFETNDQVPIVGVLHALFLVSILTINLLCTNSLLALVSFPELVASRSINCIKVPYFILFTSSTKSTSGMITEERISSCFLLGAIPFYDFTFIN